jgi:hypothetical protein
VHCKQQPEGVGCSRHQPQRLCKAQRMHACVKLLCPAHLPASGLSELPVDASHGQVPGCEYLKVGTMVNSLLVTIGAACAELLGTSRTTPTSIRMPRPLCSYSCSCIHRAVPTNPVPQCHLCSAGAPRARQHMPDGVFAMGGTPAPPPPPPWTRDGPHAFCASCATPRLYHTCR